MKNAQQALSEVMQEKEEAAASEKRKQAVMDEILTFSPIKSAESSIKDIPRTGKVYHEMFKKEKLFETMSVVYDFIPKATRDAIRAK